jgi:hypothetical protein
MKIVSEVKTHQELNEIKSVMEIFIVNSRIREITRDL